MAVESGSSYGMLKQIVPLSPYILFETANSESTQIRIMSQLVHVYVIFIAQIASYYQGLFSYKAERGHNYIQQQKIGQIHWSGLGGVNGYFPQILLHKQTIIMLLVIKGIVLTLSLLQQFCSRQL